MSEETPEVFRQLCADIQEAYVCLAHTIGGSSSRRRKRRCVEILHRPAHDTDERLNELLADDDA